MGQGEIIEILKNNKSPMRGREIAELLHQDFKNIINTISKLLKYGELKYIEVDRIDALKKFGSKRKLRLYYISWD